MGVSFNFGNYKLKILKDTFFYIDAGTLFGLVPKKIWQKEVKVDKNNCVKVVSKSLLIQTKQLNIIIDTGIGVKLNNKLEKFWNISRKRKLLTLLKKENISPEKIDIVILSHLHFDHSGWNTIYVNNELKPTFPNAKYIIQKKEWKVATNPDEIYGKRAYLPENILPIKNADKLILINGNVEIVKGITCILTGGHTPGHQIVKINTGSKTILFLGDLVPTHHHIKLTWNQSFDLMPLENAYQKKYYFEKAIDNKWLLIFSHDIKFDMCYLNKDGIITNYNG